MRLSTQEQNIAELIALGYSRAAIAGQLGIAESTVKNYETRIREKTGARSKTDIAVLVLKQVRV